MNREKAINDILAVVKGYKANEAPNVPIISWIEITQNKNIEENLKLCEDIVAYEKQQGTYDGRSFWAIALRNYKEYGYFYLNEDEQSAEDK